MIITNCAACAAPLPHKAKQCSRCKTRYCGPACQKQHWDAAGGHKDLCKLIKKGGGAEQYHADKKFKDAVAVAVEKCADDTKGQTCYICTQALHWRTKEGLVRMCACRGTAGFAHVSCLAEQAKILREEAEENNLDRKVLSARFARWHTCSLCEQQYHGVVCCALGWACWKTYLGRPEGDRTRGMAMTELGNGLSEANHHEDALSVREANLAMLRRLGASENRILASQSNLANSHQRLGNLDDAMRMRLEIYCGALRLNGEEHEKTLVHAFNYVSCLNRLQRFKEVKSVLSKATPIARRVFGEVHGTTLKMRSIYAKALYRDTSATLEDLREAVTTLEDTARIARRVLGSTHPLTEGIEGELQKKARAALRARETPSAPPLAPSSPEDELDEVDDATV